MQVNQLQQQYGFRKFIENPLIEGDFPTLFNKQKQTNLILHELLKNNVREYYSAYQSIDQENKIRLIRNLKQTKITYF